MALPCPQCGGTDTWSTNNKHSRHRIWCSTCSNSHKYVPPGEYVICQGCQEQIRPGGLKKHQQTDKCRAATLAAFARACGYTNESNYGVPEVLRLSLRTEYRTMAWGRGGVRKEAWAPTWAVELNQSLMALQGEPPNFGTKYWDQQEQAAKARGELILQAAPAWMGVRP